MKKTGKMILLVIMIIMFCSNAMALDIETLDKVSVLMNKSKVISLLGKPDQIEKMKGGLIVETYTVKNMDPMVSTGCIYEDDQRLVGMAFVFKEEMNNAAAERLKKHGFIVTEETKGTFRLLGKDDDTGTPLMAHILSNNGLTIVMTFEKGFYDRRVK
jgi:hypothetical protein